MAVQASTNGWFLLCKATRSIFTTHNNTSGQITQSLPHVVQDGGQLHHPLVSSLPSAPQGSARLLHLGAQNDLILLPLSEKLRSKIAKRVDFNDPLSDNTCMYPHPSFSSSQNNFTLTADLQDATTLAFVPSQRKKRRIDGLSSWLEAWNVLCFTFSQYPQLGPHLLIYQDQVCKFSRKIKISVNEQLYNDIL